MNYISSVNGNIITINQNIPINDMASVMISLDTTDTLIPIEEIVLEIGKMKHVVFSRLLALE